MKSETHSGINGVLLIADPFGKTCALHCDALAWSCVLPVRKAVILPAKLRGCFCGGNSPAFFT